MLASAGATDAFNAVPASVRLTLRVVRLNNRTLSCSSRILIVRDIAVGVTPNSAAALAKFSTLAALEVTEAVVAISGADRVGIRLSPVTPDVGNTPLDSNVMATYGHLIRELNRFQLAYLHVVEGVTGGSRAVPEDVDLDQLRAMFTGPYIGNNDYDLHLAIDRRAQGKIDAVAFGRLFIANPDLVARLRHGQDLVIAPRESCYNGGATGFTDWPVAS